MQSTTPETLSSNNLTPLDAFISMATRNSTPDNIRLQEMVRTAISGLDAEQTVLPESFTRTRAQIQLKIDCWLSIDENLTALLKGRNQISF